MSRQSCRLGMRNNCAHADIRHDKCQSPPCYNAKFPKSMAKISPFRALRYDPARVKPAQTVTQPYDKITPAMQEAYYQASPYNLVRIILGKRDPDEENNNVYTRAAAHFRDWRRDGIFLQDPQP